MKQLTRLMMVAGSPGHDGEPGPRQRYVFLEELSGLQDINCANSYVDVNKEWKTITSGK